MRFILAFGLCGIIVAAIALRLARQATDIWWVLVAVEVYIAACLLSLATAYGLREAGISVEDYLLRPGWSPVIRVILLPYLALGGITLFLARWFDREGLLNPVAPGLYIGRLPFPFERLCSPRGRNRRRREPQPVRKVECGNEARMWKQGSSTEG